MPTDGLYGSQIDREFVDRTDIGGVFVGPGAIADEAVTPDTFETTPPEVPTGLTVDSESYIASDGAAGIRLVIDLVQPTDTDLLGCVLHITNRYTGPEDTPVEDFSYPSEHFLARDASTLVVDGVQGATRYWVRARSRDIQGNESDWTDTVEHTTIGDTVAPDTPQSVVAVAGFRGAAIKWAKSTAADLAFYVVRYSLDSGGASDGIWTEVQVLNNVFWLTGLTPDVTYWFGVSAVDRSGNESDFSTSVSAVPTQVGAADIAANSVTTDHIDTNGLSAQVIKTGLMEIQFDDTSRVEGIKLYSSSSSTPDGLVSWWDDRGLDFYEYDSQSRFLRLNGGGIELWTEEGIVAAMTPDGIDASAITFGRMRGGANALPNSSFENGTFLTESSFAHTTFTTGAAATNATDSAGAITITTLP